MSGCMQFCSYWFGRLLAVKTYEEAINYKKDIFVEFGKNQIVDCCEQKLIGECPTFDPANKKICARWKDYLVNSIRGHFLFLGFPFSILDDLDEISQFITSSKMFERFPTIDFCCATYIEMASGIYSQK